MCRRAVRLSWNLKLPHIFIMAVCWLKTHIARMVLMARSVDGLFFSGIQYVVVPKSRLVNFKFKPIYIAVWSGRIRRIEIVNAGEHERKSFFAKTILRRRYIHNLRLRLYDVNKYYISERVLNAQRKNSVIIVTFIFRLSYALHLTISILCRACAVEISFSFWEHYKSVFPPMILLQSYRISRHTNKATNSQTISQG